MDELKQVSQEELQRLRSVIANPKLDLTKPILTRDGSKVRILCTDANCTCGEVPQPIVGIVEGSNTVHSWCVNGTFSPHGTKPSGLDLVNFAPKEQPASDTPKTDAAAFMITNDHAHREAVFARFARTQERHIAALTEAVAELERAVSAKFAHKLHAASEPEMRDIYVQIMKVRAAIAIGEPK